MIKYIFDNKQYGGFGMKKLTFLYQFLINKTKK